MIKPELFAAIRGSNMLQGLTEEDLARLAVVCEERQMAEGTTVFIENMPGGIPVSDPQGDDPHLQDVCRRG